ncbi:hypothetical protein [Kineococcus sp. SYSU DK001]|uniref:hypothetical protein n=1 Tax=Kineococcus sp. SYSU DK001 TaxID=3383122 RepID=UPI003D7D3F3F
MSRELGETLHVRDRVAYVLPDVPHDAPAAVREGIARRRITATGGQCPCGARMRRPSRAERRQAQRTGGQLVVDVRHESDCPAVTATLTAAVRMWRAGGGR